MLRRIFIAVVLASVLILMTGCHHNVQNPIANVNSKQPDKVLFDRAMEAMKKGKFDVARMTLQTLINTYPDSEFLARAKLAIGDSWYAEGGSAALAQAEIEYKDFITFFPGMPEAAEAQLKVADIHFRQMEKPDRDYTHAKRAEEEYKQVLLQFPDSQLVPIAKKRLLAVQEVLAEREYRIGRFYFLRESWPAAIARLKSLADTYPLYSKADDALYMLGQAYEGEMNAVKLSSMPEALKERLIADNLKGATDAYDRILTKYPIMPRATEAKARLEALKEPVPTPTKEAIAENKKIEASRGQVGRFGSVMNAFHRGPMMATAATVGEPTLVEPKQADPTQPVRDAEKYLTEIQKQGGGGQQNTVTGEVRGSNGAPPPNEAPPSSNPPASGTDPNNGGGVPELTPNTQPAAAPATQPQASDDSNQLPPPPQVNEAAPDQSQGTTDKAATPGSPSSTLSKGKTDDSSYSSSKKKKKKGIHKLVPF